MEYAPAMMGLAMTVATVASAIIGTSSLFLAIELLGAVIGAKPVIHLHWGGGKPSVIGPDIMSTWSIAFVDVDLSGLAVRPTVRRFHVAQIRPSHPL
jgi:hypothetical protein